MLASTVAAAVAAAFTGSWACPSDACPPAAACRCSLRLDGSWRRQGNYNSELSSTSENRWRRSSRTAVTASAIAPVPEPEKVVSPTCDVEALINQHWDSWEGFCVDDEEELAMIDRHGLADAGSPITKETTKKADAEDAEDAEDEEDIEYGASTYGEVTANGARTLFEAMALGEASDAVFFDLGSGVGRLIVQAWLELPEQALAQAVGVELSPTRHAAANLAWGKLAASGAKLPRMGCPPEFRCESMLETDLSVATHIYVSSLCMDDEVLNALWAYLKSNAPRLKCLASLKVFPASKAGWSDLEKIEMTWTQPGDAGSNVFVYEWSDAL